MKGINIFEALFIAFVVMQCCGVIDWHWWEIGSPLILEFLIDVFVRRCFRRPQ